MTTLSAPLMFLSRFIRTDYHADRFSYRTGFNRPDGHHCRTYRITTHRPTHKNSYIDPWAQRPLVSNVPSLPHYLSFQAIGLVMVGLYWATARVGVHRLFLRLPYLGVFSFTLLHLPLDFIRVSSLRPMCLHPFGRTFTYSLFR